jgi:hypothetical protein
MKLIEKIDGPRRAIAARSRMKAAIAPAQLKPNAVAGHGPAGHYLDHGAC